MNDEWEMKWYDVIFTLDGGIKNHTWLVENKKTAAICTRNMYSLYGVVRIISVKSNREMQKADNEVKAFMKKTKKDKYER